jgi:hypothetical protein
VTADVETAVNQASSGFLRLHEVPGELGTCLGELFQPSPRTKASYQLLTVWLKPERPKLNKVGAETAEIVPFKELGRRGKLWWALRRVGASWRRVVAAQPLAFALALMIMLLPLILAAVGLRSTFSLSVHGPWAGALVMAWLLASLLVATVAAAARLLWATYRALPENGFGLCDGHTRDPATNHVPLTDWISSTIDEMAGCSSRPLTFGDLWGDEAKRTRAELRKPTAANDDVTPTDRREFTPIIDLKVMTTNLTFRRPYEFPFLESNLFYFCKTCWKRYFPENVINYLIGCTREEPECIPARRDGKGPCKVKMRCPQHDTLARALPDAADMPIVVGVRLSLSFPGLISAVPLLCVDYSRAESERALICSWFSDGGIASNFPMHFFDAPWPRRPTFGIDLQPTHPDFRNEWVWRPPNGSSVPFPRSHELTSVTKFFVSMVRTMQNWADATQITLPGYRDRVTEVRIGENEGGLNLHMAASSITTLAGRGSDAACAYEKFDLDVHRWVRYRAAMSSLSDVVDNMADRYLSAPRNTDGYKEFLDSYGPGATEYGHLNLEALAADTAATAELMQLAEEWRSLNHPLTTPEVPDPRPRLRQTPPL